MLKVFILILIAANLCDAEEAGSRPIVYVPRHPLGTERPDETARWTPRQQELVDYISSLEHSAPESSDLIKQKVNEIVTNLLANELSGSSFSEGRISEDEREKVKNIRRFIAKNMCEDVFLMVFHDDESSVDRNKQKQIFFGLSNLLDAWQIENLKYSTLLGKKIKTPAGIHITESPEFVDDVFEPVMGCELTRSQAAAFEHAASLGGDIDYMYFDDELERVFSAHMPEFFLSEEYDLKKLYVGAKEGLAHETFNKVKLLQDFVGEKLLENKIGLRPILRGEILSPEEDMKSRVFFHVNLFWLRKHRLNEALISFLNFLSPYSGLQDAVERIAAEEEKTPEEVEAELGSRFPLAFENQE